MRTEGTSVTPAPVLTFLGGAGSVTGSKTMFDIGNGRVLVDCGLFQGHKSLRLQNWAPFPVPPQSLDAVILTHAHLDHCGYLPRLARSGFTGPVYCTPGTRELAEIILPDSGHLQEEEARFANRKGYSKHDPAEPLYTKQDALDSLNLLRSVPYDHPREILDGLVVTWRRTGHILGAATVSLHSTEHDVVTVFSGDLGRSTHPILLPPAPIGRADVVVCESTYGDEKHAHIEPDAALSAAINHIVDSGGVLIVPAFAVDRTEVVLWHLDRLVAENRIPDIPIFVDSPMACRALDVYRKEVDSGSPEIRPEVRGRDLFPSLRLTETVSVEESMALNDRAGPMVILSASGMATGGRVLHHLAHHIGSRDNAVLLVGFQAPGTRGEALRNGARELKMLGKYFTVAAEIFTVDLSAHADRADLLDWLGTAQPTPRMVYVNHGEPEASAALVRAIDNRFGLRSVVPRPGERVRLDQ
ncbi:MAG TPA: MBL fold metallo-hydrolase [Acidimicrobiia bacterium]|nr:MBL fold metallo-hydrolase [Acidimicrobiia bacterium]